MRCLFIIFFFIFFISSTFAQSFFENSKPLIVWNSGSMAIKSVKLKNGGLLYVKFDGYGVNVIVTFGTNGYSVQNFQETNEWIKIEITEYDFDKDGNNELIIAYGDETQAMFNVLIYKISKLGVTEIGNIELGQFNCLLLKNKIILPFGSQGLFHEYTLIENKFIQTN
ncbi:hypothetical protein [Bernardetia sp. MNP-M8]|uniref:hypothetical protein n=1 Tax=Bernardetia sp. MNP-M8 TaxID=3127470 RepID=UPI0030CCFDE6